MYLVGALPNNGEGELGTIGVDEFQEWSFASLDQPQASLGWDLLLRVINGWEEYISHPKEQNDIDREHES